MGDNNLKIRNNQYIKELSDDELLVEKINSTDKKSQFRVKYSVFLMILSLFSGIVSFECAQRLEYNSLEILKIKTSKNSVMVNIPYGMGTRSIADMLYDVGVIKNTLAFRIVSKVNGFDGEYQAGTHIVSPELKYSEIMRILVNKPDTLKITIPEGYNYNQIIDLLEKNGIINRMDFIKVMNENFFDYRFLNGIRHKNIWIEGYLFPDTYEFMKTTTSEEVIRKFLDNFESKFEDSYYIRAERMGMTIDEVITLASIVEKEAKLSSEKRVIAGVFFNRLNNENKQMRKLQSCATVQYILFNKNGAIKDILSQQDTRIDNPYNTYVYEGLPPGPICCPGKEAIEAVLYPEKNDYLYFVANKDGSHIFSKTYKQHLAAIKKASL